MWKKTLVTATLAAGLVLGSAGVASAHECYIPKRSEQGNANATHSQNWGVLTLEELFSFAHIIIAEETGEEVAPLTPEQVQEAVGMAADAGIPTTLTTFTRKTLPVGGGGAPSDGKGIDHYFESFADDLFGIFFTVQAA